MLSSKLESDGGECGVGSIVWVRRRNGSWWPGKILEPEELTTSHLTSPRTGTPVKLLGRDDASVDWYNLEKSKRVKAFRCGEFDDCIERAEASLGMPTRKREKYARREDAILHALELEKELMKKQGKLGVVSDHVSNSSGSVKKELVTSSGALDISIGHPANKSSNQFSERPEISLKDKNVSSPLNLQKNKDRDQPSFEDEHSEVIPRMRGLKDLELRTAPPKRKVSSPSASDGSGKLTVDNNCQTPSSSAPGMGRTNPANGEQTGVFRSKRSRCIYLPAVSGETLDHKEIPPSQMGMSHLQFEDGDCGPRTGFSVEESSSGLMEDDETDSSESGSESDDDSSETELDVDEEMTPVSGASMRREAEFGSQALEEHGSTSSEEHDQSALSGDMSHPHPLDRISAYEAVSKWQLKGKRNIRHLTKSSADGTDRRNYDGSFHGAHHEVKGAAFKLNKSRQGLSFWRNDDFSEAVDDADSDDRDFCTQMIGLDRGCGYRLRASSKGLNSFSRNIIDWDNMTWGDQPALRGHWGNKVGQFRPGFIGRYNFGGRTRSMLVDVDLKVQASYQKGRVPIVSMTSKLNGKAIIGHPIQIEAVEDGSSECLIPANNYFGNAVVDHDRTLTPAWRTVRRTNFRVPRSVLSSSPNGDMAAGSHSVLDEGRRLSKKSNIRSFGYKESPVRRNQSLNSRPTMGRKSLKKLPKKDMDLPSLALILQGALSPNPDERKAAEHSLNQFQYTPQHLVRLLQIIVDNNCDLAVRQVASIHFKNFVAKNWAPHEPNEQQKISQVDKDMVRDHILVFVAQVPPLLRVQLGECLKTIIHADYPEQWLHLLDWVKHNLQDQQVYGALFVLRILSRKYEFKSDEERTPVYRIVEETFHHLLNIFNRLVQIVNPSLEVADLIKLICKIFWSSIYLEIPKQLLDPNVFNAWMILFLNVLERPVPSEGEPADPELRKSWGWWKVKKWTVHILNRLYTRFGDLKLQNPENRAFAQMFQKNYAGKILECHLNLLNRIRVGSYLPDRVTNLILQYLSNSISKNSMYNLLQPRLDVLLFEIVFPLMCFNDNDQKLWDEDPHEYVRKGYDIIEDLYSPRTASMDFVSELVRKRGKENLQKFIQFIVGIFKRYDETPVEYKPYRQKDGALLAIGALCDKLKQTEPYKSELERMLVQHVFPEFSSPVGHLRAKAAWVAGQYAHINFSDQNNFRKALHSVVSGLRDPELPVRVDSVFALRSFVEACRDLNEIRPILPQLLDEFFKLMNEVENEDLVFTLETIVDKFGEEMAPYALGLCQNLAAAFWRCMNTAEADEDADDPGALAAVGCLRAISTILESVSRLPHLFVQIEPTLLPIMRRMLTTDGQEVFEEVLEIVSYMTFFSPTISLEMWSLWPLMMEALADWAIDFFPNILVPLDNYISRGTAHFLTCKEPDYQQSLWNMISSILADKNLEDGDIEPAPKLIEVVFQNCKGQVDHWVEPYLRITVERLRRAEKSYLKCLLVQVMADALYYNSSLTLSILHKLGVATEVFNLWFQMLQQVKKSGLRVNFKREHDKKVCCLGLTSLLALPADQLPGEALGRVFRATLDLLVAYKDQVAEAAKEEEADDDDDMDGFQTDDEDDDGDGSDKEMGVDAEDGDEADSIRLQKLAAQARAFRPHDEDDDDSDDDFSDDEELQSPIDEVDPFVFFMDTIKAMQASDPSRFQNLTQTLEFQYQALANGVAQHADQRRIEIEKEKMEKASAAATQ